MILSMRLGLFCSICLAAVLLCQAWKPPLRKLQQQLSSLQFSKCKKALGSIALALAYLSSPSLSHAEEVENEHQKVYFGVGCFWHVQHEFVETERKVLHREDSDLTSLAGYAGGKDTGKEGQVCYHNFKGFADYGSLGHGEVVALDVPRSSYKEFVDEYFSLFGADNERPDKGDVGAEYRSLVGLPKGEKNEWYPILASAAEKKGITLKAGIGNDPDTLFKKTVWVMDSEQFPFYPAEVYHQYHDGFMPGEQYPQSYNDLRRLALDEKKIAPGLCPEKSLPF